MEKKLPSTKTAERAEKKQQIEEQQKEAREKLERAMRETFASPSGQIVLKWLHDECQFARPILGAVSGQIDRDATLYQAMRLNLYLKVRSFLTFNILKEIEYED